MTPRVVLFDLDDTLLDYSSRVAACWAEAVAAGAPAGVSIPELVAAVEDRRAWFWNDPARHRVERTQMLDAWTKIAVAAFERIGRPSPEVARAIAVDFAGRRRDAMRLFDDALPCLDAFRRRGCRLGMVTNGDAGMQRDKIARFELEPWFDAIVIEGEFGAGKPDPAVYHHILERLDVAPRDAMMVGDNLEWDVDGAQRVGLAGVWIDRRGRGLPHGGSSAPTRVIASLAELHA